MLSQCLDHKSFTITIFLHFTLTVSRELSSQSSPVLDPVAVLHLNTWLKFDGGTSPNCFICLCSKQLWIICLPYSGPSSDYILSTSPMVIGLPSSPSTYLFSNVPPHAKILSFKYATMGLKKSESKRKQKCFWAVLVTKNNGGKLVDDNNGCPRQSVLPPNGAFWCICYIHGLLTLEEIIFGCNCFVFSVSLPMQSIL